MSFSLGSGVTGTVLTPRLYDSFFSDVAGSFLARLLLCLWSLRNRMNGWFGVHEPRWSGIFAELRDVLLFPTRPLWKRIVSSLKFIGERGGELRPVSSNGIEPWISDGATALCRLLIPILWCTRVRRCIDLDWGCRSRYVRWKLRLAAISLSDSTTSASTSVDQFLH